MLKKQEMFMLTMQEANAPRPKPPVGIRGQDWIYYWEDLACWKATQAERYLSGVKEPADAARIVAAMNGGKEK